MKIVPEMKVKSTEQNTVSPNKYFYDNTATEAPEQIIEETGQHFNKNSVEAPSQMENISKTNIKLFIQQINNSEKEHLDNIKANVTNICSSIVNTYNIFSKEISKEYNEILSLKNQEPLYIQFPRPNR